MRSIPADAVAGECVMKADITEQCIRYNALNVQ